MTEVESAVAAVGNFSDRPSGRLRLNLPRLAASLVLAPVLGRFAETFPDIHLELVIDDGLTDVVAEGFDAGVRQGERLHRDMVAVRLTPDTSPAVVGSPIYFERRGRPSTPRDLVDHSCINYRFSGSGSLFRWEFMGPDGPIHPAVQGMLTINDSDLILTAAMQGAGLAFLSESYVEEHLASGKLERVLEGWSGPLSGFFLYYPSRRHTTPALRALIDFLRQNQA